MNNKVTLVPGQPHDSAFLTNFVCAHLMSAFPLDLLSSKLTVKRLWGEGLWVPVGLVSVYGSMYVGYVYEWNPQHNRAFEDLKERLGHMGG